MSELGRHVIGDFSGCTELGPEVWDAAVRDAVEAMGARLVSLHIHPFAPRGTTGVAILAESHLAFHTWPERDYVAVDIFTCGQGVRPAAGIAVLERYLQPRHSRVQAVTRGDATTLPLTGTATD